MSSVNESYYVPVSDEYGAYDDGYGYTGVNVPANVTQTYVSPVPRVNEIHVNELLPLRVSPTYTVNRFVVRSNVADRGALANNMLLAWRPEDLDYGSDVDTTTLPQVYLFPGARERDQLQQQLYNEYPELNLQSYRLKVPVRIATHTLTGANMIPRESYIIPGSYDNPGMPSAIIVPQPNNNSFSTVQTVPYEPLTLPPEVTNIDTIATTPFYQSPQRFPATNRSLTTHSRHLPLLPPVSGKRSVRSTTKRTSKRKTKRSSKSR